MRTAGQAKAGFYPTPAEVARLIGRSLQFDTHSYALDPCCGEGRALATVATGVCRTHGIELNRERKEAASLQLDEALEGDSLKVIPKGKYSLLFLNPPYDQAEGKRLELRFLQYWHKALMPGGVLVYVVPETYLNQYAPTLTAWFDQLTIKRFPAEHYEAYKQVVIFGIKRRFLAGSEPLPDVNGELVYTDGMMRYRVPEITGDAPYLYLPGQNPEVLLAEVAERGVWHRLWDQLAEPDAQAFQPLMPLRKGHLVQLMASGLLNNTVIEGDGHRLLVKGRVYKDIVTTEEESDNETKTIEREFLKTELTALDLNTAELITVR